MWGGSEEEEQELVSFHMDAVGIPGCRDSRPFPSATQSWQHFFLALRLLKAETGTEFFGRCVVQAGTLFCVDPHGVSCPARESLLTRCELEALIASALLCKSIILRLVTAQQSSYYGNFC